MASQDIPLSHERGNHFTNTDVHKLDLHSIDGCANIKEVVVGVERLLNETNEDLRLFREEQSHLRGQVTAALDENCRLTSELDKYRGSMDYDEVSDMRKRLEYTSYALAKSRKQNDSLRKDRDNLIKLQECSKVTVNSLENELKTYRTKLNTNIDEQEKKFLSAIKLLENKVAIQKEQLQTQEQVIKELHQHKLRSSEEIQNLQSKMKERAYDVALIENQVQQIAGRDSELADAHKKIQDLTADLIYTRTMLEESNKREALALAKVQDAVEVSEAAVREKHNAELRAETFKEETSRLANNIGSIMEEAAKRVDDEVAQLKSNLLEKDKSIVALREQLIEEIDNYKSTVKMLKMRNNRLEIQYNEVLKQNDSLVDKMELTSKRLSELELLSSGSSQGVKCGSSGFKFQMKHYMDSFKELKLRYKAAIDDLTKRFEYETHRFRAENDELRKENELLKIGAKHDAKRTERNQPTLAHDNSPKHN